MKKNVLLILLISLSLQGYSQKKSNHENAIFFYRESNFDKAVPYFKKLLKQSNSSYYFNMYIDCLVKTSQFKVALSEIKAQMKRDRINKLVYKVEYGHVMRYVESSEKTKVIFEEIVSEINRESRNVSQIANSFINKREYSYAAKVYQKHRSLLKEKNRYAYDLAYIYIYQRNHSKMVDEIINMVVGSNGHIQFAGAIGLLRSSLRNEDSEHILSLLEDALIVAKQEFPNANVLDKIMVWCYVEMRNFEDGYIFANALFKRSLLCSHLFDFAQEAIGNKEYEIAEKSYLSILNTNSKDSRFLREKVTAEINLLFLQYKKIQLGLITEKNEMQSFVFNSERFLEKNKIGNTTLSVVLNSLNVRSLYFNDRTQVIKELKALANNFTLAKRSIARVKMQLADILVADEKMWEAIIYLSQIIEDNGSTEVAYQARFTKAKLSFYKHDFDWTLAQLNILKASTDKYIANDAMIMAMFISDNMEDSENLCKIADAKFLMDKNEDSLALVLMDSVITNVGSPFRDNVKFMKAELLTKTLKYDKAVNEYRDIIKNREDNFISDKAIYFLARLYSDFLNKPEESQKLYKQILTEFRSSVYVDKARKNYREKKGADTPKEDI